MDANYPRATPSIGQMATTEGEAHSISRSKNVNNVKSPLQKPAVPRKESVLPDVAAAAARKRVEKLEVVLFFLGQDDDIFLAHDGGRTQTGRVCPWEFGRGCCGAGKAGSIVGGWGANVESAFSRGKEQSVFFHCCTSSGGRFCRVKSNARVSSTIYNGSWPGCGQFNCRRRGWDRCNIAGRSPRVHARCGLRGSCVGEASNPGPSFLRLRRDRSATVNISVDSGQFSVLIVDDVDPVGLQTTQVDASRVTGADTESVDSTLDEEPQSPKSGEVEDEETTPVTLQFGAVVRAAFAVLDRIDLEAEFTTRACVMKSPRRS